MKRKPFFRCPCGAEFPQKAGPRGCPECEGDNEATLIHPAEEVDADAPALKRKGLSPQQEAFAQALATGIRQAPAYRLAYPASKAWKAASVWTKASHLAKDVEVQTRVAEIQAELRERFLVEEERLLRATAAIAFADPRRLVNDSGFLLTLEQLDGDTAAAIASVEQDEFGRIKYKFWDKNSALERLFKHKGMFEKDNAQKEDALTALLQRLPGRVLGVVPHTPQPPEGD